jgi:hypothetical protein
MKGKFLLLMKSVSEDHIMAFLAADGTCQEPLPRRTALTSRSPLT